MKSAFTRHELPQTIVRKKGTQSKTMCDDARIVHTKAAAHHLHLNGQAKRFYGGISKLKREEGLGRNIGCGLVTYKTTQISSLNEKTPAN